MVSEGTRGKGQSRGKTRIRVNERGIEEEEWIAKGLNVKREKGKGTKKGEAGKKGKIVREERRNG